MNKIKNVSLEFSCPQKPAKNLHCEQCSRRIIDFTDKSKHDLELMRSQSKGSVCGLFNRSQLSEKFLRYAAATIISTAPVIHASGQSQGLTLDSIATSCLPAEAEDEVFLGIVVESQPEPIGGHPRFLREISNALIYPPGLKGQERVFVQIVIDTLGNMSDVSVIKWDNEQAAQEAIRAVSSIAYKFKPAMQRGKPIESRMVIPVIFDPTKDE